VPAEGIRAYRGPLEALSPKANLAEVPGFVEVVQGLAQRKDSFKGSTQACAHGTDPSKPIGRWKEAWTSAKKSAGVQCRFQDLRHTGCTRMLEGGIPFSVEASIMGWSASTTVCMSKRYGQIGHAAQRRAVEALDGPAPQQDPKGREPRTLCYAQ